MCKLIRMGLIVLFETSRVRLIEYSRYRDSTVLYICFHCIRSVPLLVISVKMNKTCFCFQLVILIIFSVFYTISQNKSKKVSVCVCVNLFIFNHNLGTLTFFFTYLVTSGRKQTSAKNVHIFLKALKWIYNLPNFIAFAYSVQKLEEYCILPH